MWHLFFSIFLASLLGGLRRQFASILESFEETFDIILQSWDCLGGVGYRFALLGLPGALWISFCSFSADAQELSVPQLHDVCLVHCRHFPPVVHCSIFERVLCDPSAIPFRYDLQTLDNTRHYFVFEAGVLALCILSNNSNVNASILMSRLNTGDIIRVNQIHISSSQER